MAPRWITLRLCPVTRRLRRADSDETEAECRRGRQDKTAKVTTLWLVPGVATGLAPRAWPALEAGHAPALTLLLQINRLLRSRLPGSLAVAVTAHGESFLLGI